MAIFDMLGRHAAPAVDDQTASKHIDQIFHVRLFRVCVLFIGAYCYWLRDFIGDLN